MLDLHLHVLPAVDDGAGNLLESRAMLERLAAEGFTGLVATPHLMEPLSPEYSLATGKAFDLIQPIAAEYNLTVSLGYEHLLSPGLTQRLRNGEPSTLADSTAVLVELPFVGWPRHTESSLFDLRLAGYRPVLAHPERYLEVQSNPERALATGRQGVALQLTFASFTGLYGRAAERTATTILEQGIEQGSFIVLSTDAHSDGRRLDSVPQAIRRIGRTFANGDLIVEWATKVVPAQLLSSEPVLSFDEWATAANGQGQATTDPDADQQRRVWGWRRPLDWVTRSRNV